MRGHDYDIEKVSEMVTKWLDFRKQHNVDQVRQNILLGELDSPSKFPFSDVLLKYQPQAVICPYAQDKTRSPICVEKYNFSPSEVLKHMTIPQYIEFFIHCLEYKSLIVEQFSEERDNEYLNSLTEEEKLIALDNKDIPGKEPFGQLVGLCVIRDLEGIGFEHIGSQGQEILRTVIGLSSDNYPELLSICYVVNSPWIFNTIWWFIQGLLAPKTVAKISLSGGDFKVKLLENIDPENIPNLVGGPYNVEKSNTTPFLFNQKYFYPDMSEEDINKLSQSVHELLLNNQTKNQESSSAVAVHGVDSTTSTSDLVVDNKGLVSVKEDSGSGI